MNLYTRNKDKAYALFVDLSKAFDTVDHFHLGNMMIERDLPPDIVFFIMHYLRNQRARIVWNGEKGQYVFIDTGVRQGGILSPFLFKLYIDHILTDISNINRGCKFGVLRLNILAYADDIVLLADTQHNLDVLYEAFKSKIEEKKLIINKKKD